MRLVKKRLADTHFRYGRDMILSAKIDEGRKTLVASIKANPWCLGPYVYLATSILGRRGVLTLKSCKKGLEHKLARASLSGGHDAGSRP